MKISQTRFAILLGCMVLPACGGDGSQLSGSKSVSSISTPSPAPTATPTPAPTATPTPTPSPTPTPTSAAASPPPSSKDDGKTIIVAEGDSISIDYAGFYTGYFGLEHPGVEYYVHAVSGSTVRKLVERQQEVLNRNADIVTVFIGANDLGGYESGRAFYDALMNYVAPLRADGSKVYVATVLPRTAGAHTAWNDNHNRIRSEVADLLRAGVGNQLDGIIDFGGHPTIGSVSATYNLQLYKDGLHPTDRNWKGSNGGHDYMYEVYNKAIEQAIVDLQR